MFDITQETKLLVEMKDIRDEINMVLFVLRDQRTVLRNLASELKAMNSEMKRMTSTTNSFKPGAKMRDSDFDGVIFGERHQIVQTNISDFEKMDEYAKETHEAVGLRYSNISLYLPMLAAKSPARS